MKPTLITQSDLNNLASLYVDSFNAPPWNENWKHQWALDRLSTIFHCPEFSGLKIEQDSKIIAAILGRSNNFLGKKECEICEFFIHPDKQRAGIGASLLKAFESQLKEMAVDGVILLTSRKMPAWEFYKKNEYEGVEDMALMYRKI